jgi:NAD(P)-dependent dehydrogenase (short-subunit alcohol dehydrogenase family)
MGTGQHPGQRGLPVRRIRRHQILEEFAPDDYAKAVRRVPMKRIGDVHADAGALVSFLLSSDATFITGQTIHVDGGIGCFR